MLGLRSSQALRSTVTATSSLQGAGKLNGQALLKRTFGCLHGPSRPTIFSSFRPSLAISAPTTTSSASGPILDLVPKISSHPALLAIQVRCGPRNTYNPSHFVRKRRHGFLSRLRTRKGRMTLARRKAKKRSTLSH